MNLFTRLSWTIDTSVMCWRGVIYKYKHMLIQQNKLMSIKYVTIDHSLSDVNII